MIEILIILLFVAVTSTALLVLKLSTANGAPVQFVNKRIKLNVVPSSVAGIGLYGLSFLMYIYLISKYDLGYIIPLTTALTYIIIFPASFFLFHEKFTYLKIIGVGFILAGVILLNINQ